MQDRRVQSEYDKSGYHTYLDEARRVIDLELSNIMPRIADLGLCERIGYVLQTRGKRLRSTLVLLSAQSVGGSVETVKNLALAIELLHAATLIHDDILDQDLFRRNSPTVNAKWGVRDAVLVGDALASLSIDLTADYGKDITKIMSRTCLLLSDGEFMDVENARERLKESDYMKTIKKKSASLFKAATQCGAIAANASPDEIEALADFGENFGLAYQIKDDLSDIIPLANALPQDVNEFRANLPIIHLCESAKPKVKDELFQAITSMKAQSPHEKGITLDRMRKGLESTGSLQYCIDKINQYLDAAIDSLEPLKECVYKGYLVRMADSLGLRSQ
jgi:geranylgeranyl pyrophosphate synthase